MDKETVHRLLDNAFFKFANSMPKNPHEYSHRETWENDSYFSSKNKERIKPI